MQVEQIRISKLKPWKMNPRINEPAVNAVARSIDRFGFNVPILCDSSYRIIAGHTRLKAAKQLGLGSVPVIRLVLDGAESEAFAVADNKTGEIAGWDDEKLREILSELREQDFDLTALGYDLVEIEARLAEETEVDWNRFPDEQASLDEDRQYALIPIKVEANTKQGILRKLREAARSRGIRGTDQALVGGKFLMAILGIEP